MKLDSLTHFAVEGFSAFITEQVETLPGPEIARQVNIQYSNIEIVNKNPHCIDIIGRILTVGARRRTHRGDDLEALEAASVTKPRVREAKVQGEYLAEAENANKLN